MPFGANIHRALPPTLTAKRVHRGGLMLGEGVNRLHRLKVEERRRGGSAERAKLLVPVLDVHALSAHSRQLSAFRHEHY